MNFLKKGPELKLSGIKVPGFLQDVYYDLKERHLLPVAAVLLVAIVAIPIALSQKGSGGGEASEAAEAGTAQISTAAQSGQLVAKAAPGLRDYRRRLEHRTPQDPFKARYTSPESTGEGTGGSSTSEPSSSSATETSIPSESTSGSESGGSETTTHSELTYYSYAIDVRVTGGSGSDRKTTVRHNLPELTMLPSRETPAIVYMGATKDGKKAVMTVSSDVQAIFGDAKCALGSERCELLVMEPGLPETFVYGGAGRTYKIELVKIDLVETDKLNRAPLGKQKQKGDG